MTTDVRQAQTGGIVQDAWPAPRTAKVVKNKDSETVRGQRRLRGHEILNAAGAEGTAVGKQVNQKSKLVNRNIP